ncbi:MAG TPA: hypothetical protein PJ994_14475 [Tepidiformaceae bacterium]|nr:hypothetical protein [Tepidiformaceae bacterium]HMO95313.1 hypothetical protein [Tepidiformaceae bacterium]
MARPGNGWACWVLAAVLPVLAACSGATGGSNSADQQASPAVTATLAPPRIEPAGGASPLLLAPGAEVEHQLIDAAAERLGVDESVITVVSLERVIWPDSCLGLLSPGRVCSQAQVGGWLAILAGPDGREHRYRGTDRYFVPE